MGLIGKIGIRPIGLRNRSNFSWSRYWMTLIPDMAFKSGGFSSDAQWLDESGNDNHLTTLCPYVQANNAWAWHGANFLADYGFTTHSKVVYKTGAHLKIFGLGRDGANSNKYMYVAIGTDGKLVVFNRAVNSFQVGTTVFADNQEIDVLVNWISKDLVNVYVNGSAVAELSAVDKNWAWIGWETIDVHGAKNGGATIWSTGGFIKETRVLSGTKTWAEINTGILAHYYHQEYWSNKSYNLQADERHLTLFGTASTAAPVYYKGVSPQLLYGYDVFRFRPSESSVGDKTLPLLKSSSRIAISTLVAPFRINETDYRYYGTIPAVTGRWNSADIKVKFPYNATTAASDTILGDILFTGVTPNAITPSFFWDDHNEAHVLFSNKSVSDYSDGNNEVKDCLYDLVLFKAARTDHAKILKSQYGYDKTPKTISSSSLIYRMIYANDSFKLSSSDLLSAKLAGLYYMFYSGENYLIKDEPLKTRFADVEKINYRNIFSNGVDTLWIYKKPLLPSHFIAALSTHLGLTDIEHCITTKDGVNYFNYDYEQYTLTSNAINFNPSASANARYDIFDRRNVVGSAKEIWHGDLVLGSAFWTWNIDSGVKKMHEPTIIKYIQAAYSGKIYARQDWDKNNSLILPYIISFITPLVGAAKTAMFDFIDFPETVNEPAIVGDGVTDDAVAINAALAANSAVMLYEKASRSQTSVSIPSNAMLVLADSSVKLNNDINLSVIRNPGYTTGNVNTGLIGYGVSVVDGNGALQDRTKYDPLIFSHNHIGINFATVDGLTVRGIEVKDTALFALVTQMSDNVLIEHIRLNQLGGQANQDGIDMGFGTKHAICRYITGQTNDDFIPLLNDIGNPALYDVVVNGSRLSEWCYYRNIIMKKLVSTNSLGGGVIRVFDGASLGISNIEWQNIYHRFITGGNAARLINFSKGANPATDAGKSSNFTFKNIKGSAPATLVLVDNTWSNIVVEHWLDDAFQVTANHIVIQGGTFDNVLVTSRQDYAPTNQVSQTGGTITNFTHIEL